MKYFLPFSLSSRSQGHRSLPLQVVEFALICSTVICSNVYRLVSFNSTFKDSTFFIIRFMFKHQEYLFQIFYFFRYYPQLPIKSLVRHQPGYPSPISKRSIENTAARIPIQTNSDTPEKRRAKVFE